MKIVLADLYTPGVETITGPLGQGVANAVGMAKVEGHLPVVFVSAVVDHHAFVVASNGDLMEGISQGATALAGHLRLTRLIVLFDGNGISIGWRLSLAAAPKGVTVFSAAQPAGPLLPLQNL